METILVPVPGRHTSPLLKPLQFLCKRALHLEELLTFWVRKDQSIIVGFNKESKVKSLTISFLHLSETIATAQIPLPRVLEMFPRYVPLCEVVLPADGSPGFRPDDLWFDSRNSRLGIVVDEELDTNLAPPESILELVLSYALSSAGFVEIQKLSHKSKGTACMLKLSLIFLGLDEQQGWYETVLIDRRTLRKYLAQRQAPLH